MRREVAGGVTAAVIVVAVSAAGCSGSSTPTENTTSSGSTTTSTHTPATSSAEATPTGAPPSGHAEVVVDGAQQNIAGSAVCTTAAGNLNIAIGHGVSGVVVVLSADATTVHSVGLGNVGGVILAFQQGLSGTQATVSKDGNVYTVSGTASGITAALPPVMVTKPFAIKVSCP